MDLPEPVSDFWIKQFGRIDRLRILAGARWCGCQECKGVVFPLSYREIVNRTGIKYNTIQRLAIYDNNTALDRAVIDKLAELSGRSPERVTDFLRPVVIK